jgi:hypothetical protein
MAPMRAKKPCGHGQCPALVSSPERFCPKHAEKEKLRQYEAKRSDETFQLYGQPRYRKFRRWFLRLNLICMRVIEGKQCTNWATVCHHRRGLRSHPEDLIDADQCAAVCAEHHTNEDGDSGKEVYVTVETQLGLERKQK